VLCQVICKYATRRRSGELVPRLRFHVPQNSGELDLLTLMLKRSRVPYVVRYAKRGKR